MIKENESVRHSVIFSLKFPKGSEEESLFFQAAMKLASVPGVENYEYLLQVSNKNKFSYGISMEFANLEIYTRYNNHPVHQAFIENFWKPGVDDFMEIDFQKYTGR